MATDNSLDKEGNKIANSLILKNKLEQILSEMGEEENLNLIDLEKEMLNLNEIEKNKFMIYLLNSTKNLYEAITYKLADPIQLLKEELMYAENQKERKNTLN